MKKMIVGIVVIAVGVGVGLLVLVRKNNLTPVMKKANVVSPTSSALGQSVPAAATNELLLSVLSPVDGATVTTATVTVRGTTAPKADVFINELETRADASGNFSGSLTLDEGENSIVVMANDERGNVAEKDLTVFH